MKVGRRSFDSSHHIYLRRRIWAMELMAAVRTKLKYDFQLAFDYVKLSQNRAEFDRNKKKSKHKKCITRSKTFIADKQLLII